MTAVRGTPFPSLRPEVVDAMRACALPLEEQDRHDALLKMIGNARIVLLGEASHGTMEFYRERARITRRLVTDHGFDAVAIEGDWPDAQRINRFVRGRSDDRSADQALRGFERFPAWMWRNTEVRDFIGWLRAHNDTRPVPQRVGFYGLDLYSLHKSMASVGQFLANRDPALARQVRQRYACFDQFNGDSQVYGLMTGLGGVKDCEQDVIQALHDLRRYVVTATGVSDAEDRFDAVQNARLVRNAQAYYRTMYLSDASSWNLRDAHMMEMLELLDQHLAGQGLRGGRGAHPPRIVVWAHNAHLGDARATEMGQERGEHNLGQLVRERYGDAAFLLGFSTHEGSVCAADDWEAPAQRKNVLPSRDDSYEGHFHATGLPRLLLPLRDARDRLQALRPPLLQRAIGVIYRPETELQSHYFSCCLPDQFDAMIHIDRTEALQALAPLGTASDDHEAPETYPAGV